SCYMLGGVWILCITIGLVPSNIDYGGLMQETGLGTRIADKDYRVVYQSRSAFPLTKEQLASASPVSIDGDTLVYRRTITGGHVYCQTDISELNRINCELEEARERTTEESELLRRTNELKEQRAQISAKSRVYDDIAVRVHAQSQKIAALSAEAQQRPEKFEMNMRQISIYAAYIKRVSNMMLLSSDGRLPKKELTLAIAESARYLSLAGVITEISGDFDDATVDEGMLISIYEQFEMLLEQTMPALHALQITLRADTVKLVMEGASLIIPENIAGTVELDDDTAFVQLRMSEGGVGR
ncbi:MAG: hypothetical protein MJ175_11245, partial [Clostridia bacterium]|nr:hypothetical protein [Clostridia bacterium]